MIPPAVNGPPAQVPPMYAPYQDRQRARIAAHRANIVYPGPVGELISREIHAWDEFGFRIDHESLILRLIDHVMELHERQKEAA